MGSATTVTAALLLVLAAGLAWTTAHAYDFYVGGRDGWVLRPSESLARWANRNRFQVNDHLVFKYKKGSDSVLLVGENAYRSCNRSHPIKKMDSGSSWFALHRPGPFFFVSGVPGRCQQGQKLVVVVISPRHKTPKVPAPSTAAPAPAPVHVKQPPALSPMSTPCSPAPAPVVSIGYPALAPTSDAPAASGHDDEHDRRNGGRGPSAAAAASGSGALRASTVGAGLALGAGAFLFFGL